MFSNGESSFDFMWHVLGINGQYHVWGYISFMLSTTFLTSNWIYISKNPSLDERSWTFAAYLVFSAHLT